MLMAGFHIHSIANTICTRLKIDTDIRMFTHT